MEPMESAVALTLPLSGVVQVTFLITLLIVIIFTIILYYHWEQFAIDKRVKTITYLAYGVVITPLLLIMGGIILFL